MGKRGRAKDKLYIKPNEYSGDGWGGMECSTSEGPRFQLLPFNHCALSFQAMRDPVFAPDGSCFERAAVLRYVEAHKTHPVTGRPLAPTDLVSLKLHLTRSGVPQCPVTLKEFTDHTHVVAIRTSGNAYAWGAVEEMNIKCRNWTDLVDGTPFTKRDIITIQDPHKLLETRDCTRFHHVAHGLHAAGGEVVDEPDINSGAAERRVLAALAAAAPAAAQAAPPPAAAREAVGGGAAPAAPAPEGPRVLYSSHPQGARWAAAGLTSTAVTPLREDVRVRLEGKELAARVQAAVGRDRGAVGYARLETSLGDLNLKLHCAAAPAACHNFITLALRGYYDGTIFHRVVRNFMVQGGDPTGKGTGGESAWGDPFRDEIATDRGLKHDGRGVLAMANSGKDSNKSQFFITFRSAPHLDGKHTIFGKLVGGGAVLDKIERVPTDPQSERPLEPVELRRVVVFQDPFAEVEAAVLEEADEDGTRRARQEAEKAKKERRDAERRQWFTAPQPQQKGAAGSGVGRYLQLPPQKKPRGDGDEAPGDDAADAPPAPAATRRAARWDFSDW